MQAAIPSPFRRGERGWSAVAQGGYTPWVDHLVPPDVSFQNFSYYANLVRRIAEDPERALHEARRRGFWND